MSDREVPAIRKAIEALFSSIQSIQLATLNANKETEISYTPFILHDEKLYIFISQLASHTQNIQQHPCLSVLLIEDESNCKNIFARKRLSLKCRAKQVDRETGTWDSRLHDFEQRHGQTVELLKSLPDFGLFELSVESGSYIQGFGQAFQLSGMDFDSITQMTGN